MAGEHLAIIGRCHEGAAPDTDPRGFGRFLGSHEVCRLLWQRDGHSGFDQRPVDVHFSSLAYREHSTELVRPPLLADNLLGPNEVEQCFGGCGCTIPGFGARLAGLTLDRCVDAVKDDPFPGDTEQRRTDDLSWTAIDRRVLGSR